MNARSLQEDLLSIPGVEGAEVEGSADRPAGLRIRIAEGADQRAVGGAIRRVLTSHGLGTDTRLPGESTPDTAEPQIAPVAPLAPDDGEHTLEETSTDTESVEHTASVAVADLDPTAVIDLTEDDEVAERDAHRGEDTDASVDEDSRSGGAAPAVGGEPAVQPAVASPDASHHAMTAASEPGSSHSHAQAGVARLASVAVEEGRDGIVVTVSASDGTSLRQAAASTEGGVEAAVVRATAQLALPEAPEATVVEIEDRRVEGVDIVMIVLEVNGRMAAGSAVVGAGRAFALARATWSALSM